MSIKKLYSNELLASFEYSNIDKDYDFYYVTTSDKYIKGGATFLDIDDIKISALQFESGKSFWVMLPKNAKSTRRIGYSYPAYRRECRIHESQCNGIIQRNYNKERSCALCF